MKSYGQYCPIARASEVLAERWTPIILRNLLLGSTTFSEIAAGAPGISRTLLTTRLRELERVGVVQTTPSPSGRGSRYQLTEAGKDLADVMKALGSWGERWMELAPEHLDPGVVLHSWVSWYLVRERLPERRVIARFQFPGLPRKGGELWIIFDGTGRRSAARTRASRWSCTSRPSRPPSPSGTWAGSNGPTPSGPSGSGSWDRPPWPGRCRPGTAAAPPPGPGRREADGVQGQELCGGRPSRYSR